jgi:uncharacterized SAM-binding protein YcdF (DUF218 family)
VKIPGLGFTRVISPWWWIRRIAALVVLLYLGSAFFTVWQASTNDEQRKVQAIIVLGAAQYNGKPSPVLKARLDHALSLYKAKQAKLIIVTGGIGKNGKTGERDTTSEAATSANYLIRNGVPDSRIRREVKGKDSYESIAASKRFLSVEGVSSVLLVTDGYHAARVKAVAREVGLDAYVSPVPSAKGQPLDRMLTESAAVAAGRLVGFRRITRFTRHV